MSSTRYLFVLALFSALLISCETEQISIPTLRQNVVYKADAQLNEVYFTDALKGIVVGDNGVFLNTVDGGLTWNVVPVPDSTADFNCISFPTKLVGYVSGAPRTIMKTTDGGITWFPIAEDKSFFYAVFPSEDVGYAINDYTDGIFKTTNGGNTWTETNFSWTTGIYDPQQIFFFSETRGVVIEDYFNYVSYTYNGGNTWTYEEEDDVVGGTQKHRKYDDISFWGYGYDTYMSGMFYTTDFGNTVDRFNNEGFIGENYRWINRMNTYDGINYSACGSFIFAGSNDGGNNWTEYFTPEGKNFEMLDAAFVNEEVFVGINDSTIYQLTAF
jgi:photosystem II stability/assembly factor-like uncharacterized protein